MKCAKNKILNPYTNRCVLKNGKIGSEFMSACKKDKIVNPITGRCINKSGKIAKKLEISNLIFKKIRESCKNYDWIIKNQIGSGGYGSVFSACKIDNCSYVIKIQPISRAYYNEVKFLKELSKYKFVPKIYDAWICKNKGYIIMEKIYRTSSLTTEEKRIQLIKIIKKLHKLNIVFFDIHKGNVMFKNNQIYLIDYGLVKKFKNKTIEITHLHSRDYGKFTFNKGAKLDYLNIDEYFGNTLQKKQAKKELKKMLK